MRYKMHYVAKTLIIIIIVIPLIKNLKFKNSVLIIYSESSNNADMQTMRPLIRWYSTAGGGGLPLLHIHTYIHTYIHVKSNSLLIVYVICMN
jgi:hypothetical protein